jgi:hypothetical protein
MQVFMIFHEKQAPQDNTEGVWLPAASGTTSASQFPSKIEK